MFPLLRSLIVIPVLITRDKELMLRDPKPVMAIGRLEARFVKLPGPTIGPTHEIDPCATVKDCARTDEVQSGKLARVAKSLLQDVSWEMDTLGSGGQILLYQTEYVSALRPLSFVVRCFKMTIRT